MTNSSLPPGQDIDYQPPAPKQGLSTGAKWGIGCSSGCLILLLVVGIVTYLAYVKVKEGVTQMLDEYTSTTPIVFVTPEADQATVDEVIQRFDAFSDAMKNGSESQPLILTGKEINLLIYHHPDWQELAGKTEVTIEGDQLTGEISLPIGELFPILEGRYLNGMATLRIGLENGVLVGYIDAIRMADKEAPPEMITELQRQNIFQDAQSDPEMRRLIQELEEIRVEDGKLIIVPKAAADRGTAAPPDSEPTPSEAPAAPVSAQ